jgi:hypothetical protein
MNPYRSSDLGVCEVCRRRFALPGYRLCPKHCQSVLVALILYPPGGRSIEASQLPVPVAPWDMMPYPAGIQLGRIPGIY